MKRDVGLLPAAAKRLVELHEGCQHVPLRLHELLFSQQPLAFGIENLEVAADSSCVTHGGEPALIPQCVRKNSLAGGVLPGLLVTDERVGNVAESAMDDVLIVEQELLALGLGGLVVPRA